MKSKSSTPVLSLFLVFLTVSAAVAQRPTPTPKVGYLRFWDMLPAANGKFDLQKMGGGASPTNHFASATSYRYSSYNELPVGRYQFGIFKSGDTKTPLKTLNVDLQPNSFFTILVSPTGIDLMNDTIDPKASTGSLVIRNYFPGTTVAISASGQQLTGSLAYGQSVVASNQPLSRVPLSMKTQLPNGKVAESSAEADFTASKHATLLIIPDTYGRFRPRVTVDGKNQ